MVKRQEALDYHSGGRPGKVEITPTKPSFTARDLSLAYTPGVAEPCREIAENPEDSFLYTGRGNLVAVVTDGSAVLGLGAIGPEAAKPVMEGKAVLFKRFADIDVFDIEVQSADIDEFCRVVRSLEPTFGGVNLEDIKAPDCFLIEKRLSEELEIPVFHDDQHGTAIICGAAFLNAMRISGKSAEQVRVVFSGAGAAAVACSHMLAMLGVGEENVLICDSKGVIHEGRRDLGEFKRPLARRTSKRTLGEALEGADVFVGVSAAGIVDPEMLQSMADSPLVLALANPDPEIPYDVAREARPDAIVGTGRSDFPNQVNNVLGFPFIFRGALDVRARKINEAMKMAAVRALAELARQPVPESVSLAYGGRRFEFGPEYIIPKPMDTRVLTTVAPAVARAACESGVARLEIRDWDGYREALERRLGKDTEVLRLATHKARIVRTRIVFPEGNYDQVLRAASMLQEDGIAAPVLIGPEQEIRARIQALDLQGTLADVEIHEPEKSERYEEYWKELYELRQRKGIGEFDAKRYMTWRMYFGAMMLRNRHADSMVAGLGSSYPEMLRPLLAVVGTDERYTRVAGAHLVLHRNELIFFADTTAIIEPSAEELAEIAISTARLARRFDVEPRVAFLSFSTFGSVEHPETRKVREACEIARRRNPELLVEGEMQADAALMPGFRQLHYPFSSFEGRANVLIFPNLSAGNIAYKIAQQMEASFVLGPFLVGLKYPVVLLSPYAGVNDVFQSAVICAMRAGTRIAALEGVG